MSNFIEEQKQLRQQVRQKRQAISLEQHRRHGTEALKHFQSWLKYRKTEHVTSADKKQKIAVFLSQDGELDTQPLIEFLWQQPNFEVYLPIIHQDSTKPMTFGLYHQNGEMEFNHFKMPQPKESPSAPRITAEDLDWVFTPLVAFDSHGYRIGMGGGYYDRSFAFKKQLEHFKPLLIGWAHSCQELPLIHRNDWDIPLEMVITELKWQCFPHFKLENSI